MPPSSTVISQMLKKKSSQGSLSFPPLSLYHTYGAEFLGRLFLTRMQLSYFWVPPWLEAEMKEIRMGHRVLLNVCIS